MEYRLSYRLIRPTSIQRLGKAEGPWFAGSFASEEIPLEGLRFPKAYRSAAEWFANLTFKEEDEILSFTRECGLLRWNWTHEGQGGSPQDQFYFQANSFRELQAQFQQYWKLATVRRTAKDVTVWLCRQLAPESNITDVEKPEDLWKLSQPRMGFKIEPISGAIGVRLVVGDLWQALCFAVLELLGKRYGQIRVCKNELCDDLKFFIAHSKKRTDFCSAECAKRTSDRNYMRRKRARLRRAEKISRRKGK